MPTPNARRVVFRIEISAAARDRLNSLSEDIGITQIAATSKLVTWFASQPDMIQAAILGLYPDVQAGPDALAGLMRSELLRWRQTVREVGIRGE